MSELSPPGVARFVAADPVLMADPWPMWRDLRESGGVVEGGDVFWVTHYHDVRAALIDAEHLSSDANRRGTRADGLR